MLRDATLDDVDALHAILSNAEAMRYWSTAPHTELAQTRAWTESMIAAARDGLRGTIFIVEHEGRVIGKFGFWREPELGFILHPDAQGRGFAREVLEALLERAFERRRYLARDGRRRSAQRALSATVVQAGLPRGGACGAHLPGRWRLVGQRLFAARGRDVARCTRTVSHAPGMRRNSSTSWLVVTSR